MRNAATEKDAYRALIQWGVDGGMYGMRTHPRLWPVMVKRHGADPKDVLAGINAALAWAG